MSQSRINMPAKQRSAGGGANRTVKSRAGCVDCYYHSRSSFPPRAGDSTLHYALPVCDYCYITGQKRNCPPEHCNKKRPLKRV